MKNNPLINLLSTDAYKLGHKDQYPNKTELVFSNLTPRRSHNKNLHKEVVFFGMNYFIDRLLHRWNVEFFNLSRVKANKVIQEYKEFVEEFLKIENFDSNHLKELYKYGRLPLNIYALKEKTEGIKFGTPVLVIWNTHKDFYWLVNYLETYIISQLWQIITSASISKKMKDLCLNYAKATSSKDFIKNGIDYQGHDFSYRGMSSRESAILSGLGHLAYWKGTDTLPAAIEYNRVYGKKEIMSVPATEHSVMSSGGKDNELLTYQKLLKLYPKGILSIVSDTWNLWKVLDTYIPVLKESILKREGKIVLRLDSGDPIDVCLKSLKKLGKIFKTIINEKGYKELPSQIGLIYGDSIDYEIMEKILKAMKKHRWASSNIVFGIGSHTFQHNMRDTLGFAMKATYIKINGVGKEIFKNPITDNLKKSAKGVVNVLNNKVIEHTTLDEIETKSDFIPYLKDGKIPKKATKKVVKNK